MKLSAWLQPFITFLLPLILTFFLFRRFLGKKASQKNLPPSPLRLPIIGHMHKLGALPHRPLLSLSKKYGPLMLLHLGSIPTLIVSSAEAAEEIMKTHDLKFADRVRTYANEKLLYCYKDVGMAPYGEYWRKMKSFCVIQLLSNKRVQDMGTIREEETALLVNKIVESNSSVVNLSELLVTLTNNVVSTAALGRKVDQGGSGRKLWMLMKETEELLGRFDVGTFIPWLAWINTVSGFNARVNEVAKENDEFFERILEERMKGGRVEEEEDFLDVLLGIDKDAPGGFDIDRDSIKALILDIIAGGTDTTHTALEWTMTELLRHPKVMKQVQIEVRNTLRGKSNITYPDDFENMHYLKAVIKETLRIHPPLPLLIPRVARQDVKFMGYDIAAGTMVIINAWGIGRDPTLWDEPDEFRPERFLNSTIDYKGHDFELIPFGAGRRGCPGINFAMSTYEFVLVNLLQKFEWELPNGMKCDELNMDECAGLTVHKKVPLLVVARPLSS
ncbi:hypothetical protein ACET3Z_022479 [Daucus carota]